MNTSPISSSLPPSVKIVPNSVLPKPLRNHLNTPSSSVDTSVQDEKFLSNNFPPRKRIIPRAYAETVIRILQEALGKEKTLIDELPLHTPEIALRQAIIQQVTDKLEKASSPQEKFEKVCKALWNHVMRRSNGTKFVHSLLGDHEFSMILATHKIIPETHHTRVMSWLWDDILIEMAARITGAPQALPNQSHADHAKAIRPWLKDPKNALSIASADLSNLDLTFPPPEIENLLL